MRTALHAALMKTPRSLKAQVANPLRRTAGTHGRRGASTAPPNPAAAPRAWRGALAATVAIVGAGSATRNSDTRVLLAALAFMAILAVVDVLGTR